ncbi:hypothetical protein PMAYCL1PPCAC_15589, partial [Pristionchus mayeri]
ASSGHHFMLTTVSVGIASVLFLSLVGLHSIVTEIASMQSETMEEMAEFKGLADSMWRTLTNDASFILGVRATRGSGYAMGGGGYAKGGGGYAKAGGGGGYAGGGGGYSGGGGGGG